jgi:hypothetical protein
LSETLPEHKIKRKQIAARINGWGETIHESTVTRRVQMVFGPSATVADAVAFFLKEKRAFESQSPNARFVHLDSPI